jgi:hypothetical protein
MTVRFGSRCVAVAFTAAVLGLTSPEFVTAQDSHLIVVEGLAGSPEHGASFSEWATTLLNAAVDRQGVAHEHVHHLLPDPAQSTWAGATRSDAEGLRAKIEEVAGQAGAADLIALVLIGHGTAAGDESRFNLPGRDLTAAEWGGLFVPFLTQRIVVVNTASASGGFVSALSASGRVIITATRTPKERNETIFPRYFVAAFAEEGSDIDRDGRISFFEAFEFARLETARAYGLEDLLSTEHALIDDNGDGEGTSEPVPGAGDGMLAATLHLAPVVDQAASPELRALLSERATIEAQIVDLRARKDGMIEDDYLLQLEDLLVALAEKNEDIRAAGGGDL